MDVAEELKGGNAQQVGRTAVVQCPCRGVYHAVLDCIEAGGYPEYTASLGYNYTVGVEKTVTIGGLELAGALFSRNGNALGCEVRGRFNVYDGYTTGTTMYFISFRVMGSTG